MTTSSISRQNPPQRDRRRPACSPGERLRPASERSDPQCAPGRSLCAIAMGQVTADVRWSITTTLGQAVGVTCRKLVAR
jgi:hypothetical protein